MSYLEVGTVNSVVLVYLRRYVWRKVTYLRTGESIKKQRSRSMEMRFFWVTDQVALGHFKVQWHPGQENLADYFTKHFDDIHHIAVRQCWYLHTTNSPRFLPRAPSPSTLRGCVGTLPDRYIRSYPLLRVSTTNPYRVPHTVHSGLDSSATKAICSLFARVINHGPLGSS